MEDFLLRNLKVNDSVIFIAPGSTKNLALGRVIKLNPKTVRIVYRDDRYDGTPWAQYQPSSEEANRPYKEVVKVDGPDLTMYLLKK